MANYLTTLRGTIHASALGEIFSHSLAVTSNDEPSAVAQGIRDAWHGVYKVGASKLDPHFHTGVIYTEATAAEILNLTNGDLAAAAHSLFSPPDAGIGTNLSLPSQTAIAVSIRGGTHANGTPVKGRFYLPPPTNSVMTAEGLLDPSIATLIRTQMKLYFSLLTAAGIIPCTWSRKDGALRGITELRVGNKLDTVRRRRNALPETYSVTTIP